MIGAGETQPWDRRDPDTPLVIRLLLTGILITGRPPGNKMAWSLRSRKLIWSRARFARAPAPLATTNSVLRASAIIKGLLAALMVVTAIIANSRRNGRFDVVVDGSVTATLSIEAIERLRLSVGTVVDEQLGTALERETSIVKTYDRALNMIALRARSSAELRRLLIRKGEPAEYVDVAIERLLRAGFLDDGSFARQFARAKALGGGLSRRRVQQELARRGVARDVADSAIAEVFAEEQIDEEDTLERVARKKLKSLARLDTAVQRRRLYSFLARRGYDSDDIARTLRTLMSREQIVDARSSD
jgi:regulatory protein